MLRCCWRFSGEVCSSVIANGYCFLDEEKDGVVICCLDMMMVSDGMGSEILVFLRGVVVFDGEFAEGWCQN